MALTAKEKKILNDVKEKEKVMKQVPKLLQDVSGLRKKLKAKEDKLSELINLLDEKNNPDEKSSGKSKVEKRRMEDTSALFSED